MTKRTGKILAMIMAAALLAMLLAGCGQSAQPGPTPTPSMPASAEPTATATPTPAPTPTPKPAVTISSMFPGTEPTGLSAVFEQLNAKLAKDISVKLELSWTPAETYDADMGTALASGKQIDFLWCGSDKLADYAGKSLIAPLDQYIAQYGQALTKNIELFDTMKITGKLMGVPSAGNSPLCDAGHVFTVREDLRQKYSVPKLDSIVNIELFFKAVHDNEPDITPLGSIQTAIVIMPAFGPEDLLGGTGGAVAYAINGDSTVTCMELQSAASFKGAVAKVREWYVNGWIPEDMVDITDSQAQLNAGKVAATDGAALQAVSQQAAIASAVPGAQLADQPVSGSKKFITGNGGSALCLAASSKNPAEVVQFWNWVLTSQDNYDLYCYGIAGKNYQLDSNNRIAWLDDSYKSFPAWMFTNMNFERFPAGLSDDYIDTLRHWNDGATISPLMGFVFDPTPVSAELASVQKVYDAYSPALNAGSADTPSLLSDFGAKMKAAGQDKIVAEAQKQINAYLASAK